MAKTSYYTVNGKVIAERSGATRLEYVSDALGSTVATLDQSRNVVATCRYTPYGQSLSPTGTQPAFCWNGASGYNQAAGVKRASHQIRARIYDDQAGQWISKDPLWPKEPTYSYGTSNPTNRVDASGLLSGKLLPGGYVYYCGGSFTILQWELNTGESDGWIVQRVEKTQKYRTCDQPALEDHSITFFEAWPVRGGTIFIGNTGASTTQDQWNQRGVPSDAQDIRLGNTRQEYHDDLQGSAVFVPGTPPGFTDVFKVGNVPQGAGPLLHSALFWKDFDNYTVQVRQSQKHDGNCCCNKTEQPSCSWSRSPSTAPVQLFGGHPCVQHLFEGRSCPDAVGNGSIGRGPV